MNLIPTPRAPILASLFALAGSLPACGGASSVSLGPLGGPSIPVTRSEPKTAPDLTLALPPPHAPAAHLAARWARVAWAGAPGAPGTVTRTEAEAEALARQIANRVDAGERMADLAARYADDPSRHRGGDLGTVPAGALPPAIAQALQATPIGRATVVRTEAGWVALERRAPQAARASWAAWGYAGGARATSTRPLAEAEQRAQAAAAAWRSGALPDADAASGAPEEVGAGQWPPALDARLWRLAPGEVSEPVITAAGVYVLRRDDEPGPTP